ncbi:MAG: hypothetical protein JNK42_04145 [Caedimonas sp.]|nr:hypothetical protein [Caedimonas sp.]
MPHAQFTGREQWFRHGLARRKVLYTKGAPYVAEHGGAYCLIDEITFNQAVPKVAAQEFQVWRLSVHDDKSATLTCDDGNHQIAFTKRIEYTDFPLPEIRFYFVNNIILLPSEY